MVHTYEYAVLTAVPNARRGERVNIGIAVFHSGRVDVRFKQATYKLRALTGQSLEAQIEGARSRLQSLYLGSSSAKDALSRFSMLEPMLKSTNLGILRADTTEEYEQRVEEIIQSLVALPAKERPDTKSRINTEIARELSRAKALASGEEGIEDGKVVRNFVIDENEGLQADFALKNGRMHVASTLDLRKHTAGLGEAALKSIVLDKAEKLYGKESVLKIGVFAVDDDMRSEFKKHIDLLGDYSNVLYDWQDLQSRKGFKRALYNAMGRSAVDLI